MAVDNIVIETLREFFDFPWAGVAGFVACFTLVLLKVPNVARWLGSGVQEMVGVTALRGDMKAMHDENKKALETLTESVKQDVTRLDARMDEHEAEKGLHNGGGAL